MSDHELQVSENVSPSTPAPPPGGEVDVSTCDREPIHIPGLIQPHGLLVTLEPTTLKIVQISRNARDLLGIEAEEALGQPVEALLSGIGGGGLRQAVNDSRNRFINPLRLRAQSGDRRFNGIAHWNDGLIVVELEPDELAMGQDLPVSLHGTTDPLFDLIRTPMTQAAVLDSVDALAEVVCDHLRRFTGFDRVMVYRFADDAHGQVIGESLAQGLEPYLGLHYPASDIPPQARALYMKQWLRQVVDVDAAAVPVIPGNHPRTGRPLDMGRCVLRSVSPIHLQYLRNMGVAATLTISLVHEDRLWGLLVCHHRTPRFVPYTMRSACELLGAVMSSQFAAKELSRQRQQRATLRERLSSMFREMSGEGQALELLSNQLKPLAELFKADGISVIDDEQAVSWGLTPCNTRVQQLIKQVPLDEVKRIGARDDLMTCCLEGHSASGAGRPPAGVLLIELRDRLWVAAWRAPAVLDMRWGGNPDKPAQASPDGSEQLSPRASFSAYVQTIRDRSRPWTASDLEAAEEFRSGMSTFIIRRLETLARETRLRHKAEQDLKSSQAKLRLAFDVGFMGYWEFDVPQWKVTSSHWMTLLGHEGSGESFDVFCELTHPDDLPRVLQSFQGYIVGEQQEYCEQFRMKHVDGRWVWIESRGRIIQRDEQGKAMRLVGVHYDIDAIKSSQQQLLSRNDEIQSFIYSVSHDLKSPLVTIKGFVGMLREDITAGQQDQMLEDLRRIESATAEMGLVIDDLLELSRLGRDGLRKVPLDLKALAHSVAESLAIEFDRCKARLVIAEQWPPLTADIHTVRRILQNLLDNALKYACDGDDPVIELGGVAHGQAVDLFVKDNGPGIDPAYHHKIFQVFERLDRKRPGTGVGLASVAKAAELHGGRAWVDSWPGKGATFWVRLLNPFKSEIVTPDT